MPKPVPDELWRKLPPEAARRSHDQNSHPLRAGAGQFEPGPSASRLTQIGSSPLRWSLHMVRVTGKFYGRRGGITVKLTGRVDACVDSVADQAAALFGRAQSLRPAADWIGAATCSSLMG
jgi:hypothetical protein